jgi:hypothetical protein
MKTLTSPFGPHLSNVWVNLATFNRPEEAQGFTQFLNKEGIEAQVQDERTLQKSWFWTRPVAGIHVRVPEASFEYAQNCLGINPAATRFLRRAVHCPSCNSVRVHYPQMTRKNVLPTLVAQLLVLLGVMKRECYCEACHYTWVPDQR